MKHDLSTIRREYAKKSLSKKEVYDDPFKQLDLWLSEAVKARVMESTAMVLSTAGKSRKVTSRIVLLKDYKPEGLVFYTNYNSQKGIQLRENPNAAALFYWAELERQVRVEGVVEKISPKDSDHYFDTRPVPSNIGTLASDQSTDIPDRAYLEQRFTKLTQQFQNKKIKRPPHWGGNILKPNRYEFWQGRKNRLHDRIEYVMDQEGWKIRRLAP